MSPLNKLAKEEGDEIMNIYKKITLAFITTSLIAIVLISITFYLTAKAKG